MNKILAIFTILTVILAMLATFPDGAAGALVVVIGATVVITLLRRTDKDNHFLVDVFLIALIARILFGSFIHIFEMREFFGADALTYDFLGNRLVEVWTGQVSANDWLSQRALATSGPGWGMGYLVAFIYVIVGHNILA